MNGPFSNYRMETARSLDGSLLVRVTATVTPGYYGVREDLFKLDSLFPTCLLTVWDVIELGARLQQELQEHISTRDKYVNPNSMLPFGEVPIDPRNSWPIKARHYVPTFWTERPGIADVIDVSAIDAREITPWKISSYTITKG